MIPDSFVKKLKRYVRFLTVCPEKEIGLGVPRETIRIVTAKGRRRLIQPATGRDLTAEMCRFAQARLAALPAVHGFILKARSPSCGIRDVKVFATAAARMPVKRSGTGFFADAVRKKFHDVPVEDEVRLADPKVRERFLKRVFALAGRNQMPNAE
jgi:uncharacterized protein YbbK (DUF523 family)